MLGNNIARKVYLEKLAEMKLREGLELPEEEPDLLDQPDFLSIVAFARTNNPFPTAASNPIYGSP